MNTDHDQTLIVEKSSNLKLTTSDKKSYLIPKVWRGEVPLVIAYWGFGCVGSLAVYFASTVILEVFFNKFLALYVLTLMICYQVFVTVSIWRSSKNYTGKTLYALLAQAGVFIGWFISVPQFILNALLLINS